MRTVSLSRASLPFGFLRFQVSPSVGTFTELSLFSFSLYFLLRNGANTLPG
jgi:hypothetical protein